MFNESIKANLEKAGIAYRVMSNGNIICYHNYTSAAPSRDAMDKAAAAARIASSFGRNAVTVGNGNGTIIFAA